MGLNIIHTNSFQFESRNNMMNAAKDILKRQGETTESADKFVERVFTSIKELDNSNLAIIKASYQMKINDSLKETLNYLKQHSNKKLEKKPIFGEIWDSLSEENYDGELIDFVIDENLENIFAA